MLRLSLFAALFLFACNGDASDRSSTDSAPTPSTDASVDQGTDTETTPDARPDDASTTPDASGTEDTEADAPSAEDAGSDCSVDNGGCGHPDVATCSSAGCRCDAGWLRERLFVGVDALAPGEALLSRLVVTGRSAFPIATDAAGNTTVAGAYVGEGRALVVGHEGMIGRPVTDGFGRLIRNGVEWMTDGQVGVAGLTAGFDGLRAVLVSDGWDVRDLALGDATTALDTFDLIVTTTYEDLDPERLDELDAYLAAGGHLLAGGHAWWFAYSEGGTTATYPGNRLLRSTGIVVSTNTAGTASVDGAEALAPDLGNALCALEALERSQQSMTPDDVLGPDALRIAAAAAGDAVDTLSLDHPFFDAARAFSSAFGDVVPTAERPVSPATTPLEALALRLQIRLALDAAPSDVMAHAAGAEFPGAVAAGAEPTRREVQIDASYAGYPSAYFAANAGAAVWRSTGLYAAPGALIRVESPDGVFGRGLEVQIGAHTDELFGLESWQRAPRLVRRERLNGATQSIASGFGGPVYITVPAGTDLGEVTLTIDGAVEAPRASAATTPTEWAATCAAAVAPWAEIDAGAIVLMTPTANACAVADPAALVTEWTAIMEAIARLAAVDVDRPRPERFLVDRQISAGWMHSGYPIMAHLESATEVLDRDAFRRDGMWGPIHELGHNHQWSDTVLPGTIETTCNLWSVYVHETVFGIARWDAHPAISLASRQTRVSDWLGSPGSFADWSVWTALETYLQLQERFGWQPFIDLHREYQELAEAERPRTEAEIVQQWIVRSSRATGLDLTDFYASWSLPVTAETRAAVEDLRVWDNHPMRR